MKGVGCVTIGGWCYSSVRNCDNPTGNGLRRNKDSEITIAATRAAGRRDCPIINDLSNPPDTIPASAPPIVSSYFVADLEICVERDVVGPFLANFSHIKSCSSKLLMKQLAV